MDKESIIREIERGHTDGVNVGDLWKVGDPDAVPNPSETSGYKDGFNKGFAERKNTKAPLAELPVDNLGPVDGEDVDFEKMARDFDGDNVLDATPLDLSIYDNEEPEQKKRRIGGKSKKRKPSKKSKKRKQSKKAKRSRKQKK